MFVYHMGNFENYFLVCQYNKSGVFLSTYVQHML